MSATCVLVCREAKLSLWVGQTGSKLDGPGFYVYGNDAFLRKLARFLDQTQGKPLVFFDDEDAIPFDLAVECDEFEPD